MSTARPIRNIAIIAHVDHGKTTLVDCLLKQSGTFAAHERVGERVMDSNDIERERGITILAKNCAIEYRGTRINIVDTPGHADFGGEVERVLSMVDGVLLLVDAVEGPMPQTRFVTRKALALGLKAIVVVNKVDRPGSRPNWVIDRTFELFDKLGATDAQLDFPIIFASALQGWATRDIGTPATDMTALFETVLSSLPAPTLDIEAPLQLQISTLDYNSYVGRIGIGRIRRGTLKPGRNVTLWWGDQSRGTGKVQQVLTFRGLERKPVDEAQAGDIVAITGIEDVNIGITICDPEAPAPLPPIEVDEPTPTSSGSPAAASCT
jgi:GTP-binding protein